MKGFFAVLFCFAIFFFASLSIGQNTDQAACRQTIQKNCTSCHDVGRICRELDHKEANWPSIIKEMGELGNLSEGVQTVVLDCLTKSENPKALVCDK